VVTGLHSSGKSEEWRPDTAYNLELHPRYNISNLNQGFLLCIDYQLIIIQFNVEIKFF
jgi:hypothetical protein